MQQHHSVFYDDLETLDPHVRELTLFASLPRQIHHAQQNSASFAKILAGINGADIINRQALAQLPITRKSNLIALQEKNPPFGGLAALFPRQMRRIFSSPGPIYEPEARRIDFWRMARALYAAGFRTGDIVHNCLSYHFTPGGWMFDDGAQALGCAVFPAGTGQTEQQVRSITDIRPNAYTGTPSFLKIILEKARELNTDVSCLRKALVSGEALPNSLRREINNAGIDIYQCYATADLGMIAYESSAKEGLILDEALILEIVRAGTGEPVATGEIGEVVITSLCPEYPLIRFATGDLSAVLAEASPCGRTNVRIKGWLGRADQTTKIKGMFVHPEQIDAVIKRHPAVSYARLVVDRDNFNDIMTLYCEVKDNAQTPELTSALENSVQVVCKLKGKVQLVKCQTLARDGKVIDDIRKYD
ncbi:coenzyme F390 synthetase [Beggiatoa alba B18LD]|uniref:Coenzyme F390 synthetase n=1 Tax=Beggiatoa alba B18LD TaxID=395493 RepID=I3CDW8_9GAMM|nr:AMP-binding protein [Beggiatoa alba]EIJ41811.1 coenzyme F390 synthetase [Beggiatoa alba B18LD]